MLLLGVGLGEDERDLRVVAHRDPLLLAGDLPALGRLLRARGQVRGVGAGVRLGQSEAAQDLAGAQARQPLVLLLLAAPALDRRAHERGLHRHDRAGRGIGAAHLLDDQRVGAVVQAAAAVLLGDDRPQVAHVAELLDQVEVEVLVAVVVPGLREDLLVGELARGVADQPLLVGQLEVDHWPCAATARSSVATRSLRDTGLTRYASAPASRCSTTLLCESNAESTIVAVSGTRSASSLSARTPPPSGMCASMIATSGRSRSAAATASAASDTAATSSRSGSRRIISARRSRTSSSSSAMSTRKARQPTLARWASSSPWSGDCWRSYWCSTRSGSTRPRRPSSSSTGSRPGPPRWRSSWSSTTSAR